MEGDVIVGKKLILTMETWTEPSSDTRGTRCFFHGSLRDAMSRWEKVQKAFLAQGFDAFWGGGGPPQQMVIRGVGLTEAIARRIIKSAFVKKRKKKAVA